MKNLRYSYNNSDISKIDFDSLFNKIFNFNPYLKINNNNFSKVDNLKLSSISELVPDLEIMFEYYYNMNPVPESNIGIQFELNLPVFSAYSKSNKILMYKSQQDSALAQMKDTENNLKNLMKREIIDLKNNIKQSNLLNEKMINLGEENLNSLIQAYQVDKIGIDSLIDSC